MSTHRTASRFFKHSYSIEILDLQTFWATIAVSRSLDINLDNRVLREFSVKIQMTKRNWI